MRLFAYEGIVYALIAAAIGSLMGVVVGLAMVRIIGAAVAGQDFTISFAFSWRSVVVAYTLGIVLTFVVVVVSSWRVSRLNIVRAIRDIPAGGLGRSSRKGLVLSIVLPVFGVVLAALGYQSAALALWMLGSSLVIVGVPLLARRLGRLPDRVAFTVAGLGLVVWWLLPFDALDSVLPDMEQGIEMFFLSGIMLVIGGVWTVMYNSDVLLTGTLRLFGHIGGLAPVLKTAVSYPMQNRLRTGMALAMFSLIVFAMTVMGFVISGTDAILEDSERLSGGYHVRANTSGINSIPDIREALAEADGLDPGDFEAIASFTFARFKMKQEGLDQEPVDFWMRGVDSGYTDSVTHQFALTADGYDSPREVWQALQDEPGTVVVDYFLVPKRNDFNVGDSGPDLKLDGFYVEDDSLPEVHLLAKDDRTGNEKRLRIIGVLKDASGYTSGIMTSRATIDGLLAETVTARSFMFRLNPGVDEEATAKALESSFLENGMQGKVIAEEIREEAVIERTFNLLLQGFMGLGLVVGIAALGVIVARSVVERRKQIGMLRALGFQKGMVQLTFLLESSFVALLGIALGIVLGSFLAYNLIQEVGKEIEGLAYRVPWVNIAAIVIIAYVASLLTTFLPARQASRVYPAEALRAE